MNLLRLSHGARIFFGNEKWTIISLFLLCLLIRVSIFILADNEPGDAMSRALNTAVWLNEPHLIISGAWPPLFYYIGAIGIILAGDVILGSRAVSLFFGSLSVIPFYFLVRYGFGRKAAGYSSILFSVYWLHISLSVQSLSEASYLFMILFGVLFGLRFSDDGKNRELLLSAFFVNLALMYRYDAIIVDGALFLIMLQKRSIKKAVAFLTLSLLFFFSWTAGNFLAYGDPFYMQSWTVEQYARCQYQLPIPTIHLERLITNLTAPIFLISILGVLISLRNRKNLEVIAIVLFILVFLDVSSFVGIVGCTFSTSRYTLLASVLLFPFFILGSEKLQELFKWKYLFFILVAAAMILQGRDTVINIPTFPEEAKETAYHIGGMASEGRVLVDYYESEASGIVLYSEIDPSRAKIAWMNYTPIKGYNAPSFLTEQDIIDYFTEERPKFVVYSNNGCLRRVFDFSEGCENETAFGINLTCDFDNDRYKIYATR